MENNEKEAKEKTVKEKLVYIWKEYIVPFGIAALIALFIGKVIILNINVPTGSMMDTIQRGDRIITLRLAYLFSEPERGDIVVFPNPDTGVLNIKRIIGLPGETLEIRDGKVYIDGSEEALEEPYLREEPRTLLNLGTYEIPEGHYFMMGDNRNNSKDARMWENTYVPREDIMSKAVFKYWKGFEWMWE